jgi:hypothetical protein
MSLIPCPECGKEVSSQAESCIGCGMPLQDSSVEVETSSQGNNSFVSAGLWFLAIPLAVGALWTGNYAWGAFSQSQCTFVAYNSSDSTSFDNAFLCFNDLSVFAARLVGAEVYERGPFILTMASISIALGAATWAVIAAARRAS